MTNKGVIGSIRPITVEERISAPPDWKWFLIADLARPESGHTPSRRHPEWWGGDVPWLALPDVRELDGLVAHETQESINAGGLANSSARLLPEGTVAMSRTASVGFVTVFGRPMATSQDFANWVCGPELDPWFLAYALLASRNYVRSLASGAIHQTIYVPTSRRLRICIPEIGGKPNLAQQKAIVRQIDQAFEAVRGARSSLTDQLALIADVFKTGVAAAFRQLSDNYPGKRLDSFTNERDAFRDGPFGSNLKTAHYSEGGARVVRLQNIGDGRFLDNDQAFVSLSHYESLRSHGVEPGDLLVAALGDDKVRAAGRACVMPDVEGPAIVKADCFRVRLPAESIRAEFVALYLNSPSQRAKHMGATRGATRPRINLSMLRSVEIPAAPIDVQDTTIAHLESVAGATADATAALKAQLAALDALPTSLLGAAFRGEL